MLGRQMNAAARVIGILSLQGRTGGLQLVNGLTAAELLCADSRTNARILYVDL